MKNTLKSAISILVIVMASATIILSQSTEITYQGQLQSSATPANGSYDFEFVLYDAGGTQIGPLLSRNAVAVANGVFSVKLDFGSSFPGATRVLEIHVRPSGGGPFTTLSPRLPITSSPYSIKAINADSATIATTAVNATNAENATNAASANNSSSLGGVAANQYVQTGDVRLADARVPLPNSPSYVQNTTSPQTANIDITGSVTVGGNPAPALAPAGQGRIYFDTAANKVRVSENGAAFVDLVGATGVSGSGTATSIPVWSTGTSLGSSVITQTGGNVGVGTNTPAHRVSLAGGPGWTSNFWTGTVGLDFASSIGFKGNGGAPVQFGIGRSTGGLYFFHTNSPLGTTGSPANYDMQITDTGSLLVTGPSVQLPNNVQLAAGTNGSAVVFGSPNSETGMTMFGANGRADVRFDGTTLRLLSGPAGSIPSNGIAVTPNLVQMPNNVLFAAGAQGNAVQFGSPNSETGMTISGAGGRADLRFDGTLKLVNGPGGIPPATNGIAINTAGNVGVGTATPTAKLDVAGTVRQDRTSNGLVKAMAFVNADGTFNRCYNGITNTTAGNCGFAMIRLADLSYYIDFGFPVNDRFVSVTPHFVAAGANSTRIAAEINLNTSSPSILGVYTYNPLIGANSGGGVNAPFMVIVY